ncbi:hypothetical protein BJ508DRAFT_415852 [Ascobolus immersus RN42]|uniref:Integral membrane protein n=1 Tax=Ascobolus immersus RN42 TaxID=1160509 RepID=A0A3N4I660_ASCIM|nr:hypothetical protein BJ508DRAFT_415852 [Ascobolus immersus RN42]
MARKRPPRPTALPTGANLYSPRRLATQILLIQSLYYLSSLILTFFTSTLSGHPFTLAWIWDWRSVRGDNVLGWTVGMLWVLNGVIAVVAITLFVTRSKLVLDFSLTLHFIHLLITTFYSHSIPRSLEWWAGIMISAAGVTAAATWTCRWRELRPMSFQGIAPAGGGGGDIEMGRMGDEEEGGRRGS